MKRRRCLGLAACALALQAGRRAGAAVPTRQALLIGNSRYPALPLRNPGRDATAVHARMVQLGFAAELLLDAPLRRMVDALQAFLAQSAEAELRVLYYAGHGVQVLGRNYLIPIDAPMQDPEALVRRSLDAGEVLDRLARLRHGANVLILDACRNHPGSDYQLLADGRRVKVRGARQGLSAMPAPRGSLVAFATAPGSVADDGPDASHSLYTRHLLQHLGSSGVPLEQMFKRVRAGVMADSGERQRPWEESSLTGEVCLAGGC